MPRTWISHSLCHPQRVVISHDASFALVVDGSFPVEDESFSEVRSVKQIDLTSRCLTFSWGSLPGPRDVAISADDSFALVVCSDMDRNHRMSNSVLRIDLATREVTYPFAPPGRFPGITDGIAISADTTFALVSSFRHGVHRIYLRNGAITTIPYPGDKFARGIAISTDSFFALIANEDDDVIGRIDLNNEAVSFAYNGFAPIVLEHRLLLHTALLAWDAISGG